MSENTKNNHAKLMESLKDKHEIILELIGYRQFHYLGYPIHGNIGDLLIMHGTLEFFKNNNLKPISRISVYNMPKNIINSNDVLVFQGGGNMGDLYPTNQKQRTEAVVKYKNNRIIFLPQSIHFESKENYEECSRLYALHNDLHIFVRDEVSYKLALKMSKNVYLAPDMAHQLWPVEYMNRSRNKKKVLFLKRADKEATSINGVDYDFIIDWPLLVGKRRFIAGLMVKFHSWVPHSRASSILINIEANLWEKYSFYLIKKAVNLFSSYDRLITNRLHGHILACLMSMPNVVLDNSYGKNSRYTRAWTLKSDIVKNAIK